MQAKPHSTGRDDPKMVFGKNFAAAIQGAPRRREEAEGKRTGKSPGPEGKRKRRARDHPERDGDREKETENRARERDAQNLYTHAHAHRVCARP